MWAAAAKNKSGQIERQRCWDEVILAGDELASILGRGNATRGKA
jgi:hypothetical protein